MNEHDLEEEDEEKWLSGTYCRQPQFFTAITEATSEPSAPVVNLPSPQPASHLSTPPLQIPEDPTTPVLAVNTSPPTTPVLQLTDEEDGQTQETQDQVFTRCGMQGVWMWVILRTLQRAFRVSPLWVERHVHDQIKFLGTSLD
ncbi:hypothetical protein JHK82_022524 [Glycine max]|nr:hypothetical protein JHK82_022524 [Glycine max]